MPPTLNDTKQFTAPSATFCLLPWIQLASKTDGKVNLCCIASEHILKNANSEPYLLNVDTFETVWNSDHLKKIRLDMLAGKKISGCGVCYENELNQASSNRNVVNRNWSQCLGVDEVNKRISESTLDEGELKSKPVFFDLRFSDKCNLKCRMCFPANSTGINEEYKKLLESEENFPHFFKKIITNNTNQDWADSDQFLNSIDRAIPFIREFYFTGGEPMLIKDVAQLLKKVCESGYASQIKLSFHTNTTVWNDDIIKMLPEFSEASIFCSIDGVYEVDELIRFPTKFSKVSENFNRYLKLSEEQSNIFISINSAVSWLNIFNLPQFANWLLLHDLQKFNNFRTIFLGLVNYPKFLNIDMIPDNLRAKACRSVEDTLTIFSQVDSLHSATEAELKSFLRILRQKNQIDSENVKDLIGHTVALDKSRSQNLKNLIPDAYSVFEYYSTTSSL